MMTSGVGLLLETAADGFLLKRENAIAKEYCRPKCAESSYQAMYRAATPIER